MSAEIRALGGEIAELRELVARLRLDLTVLQRAVLERGSDSDQSFSVVHSSAAGDRAASYPSGTATASEPPSAPGWEDRLSIAKEVGKFLERANRGDHRGESGRSRLPLASRFWIVVRGFDGEVYNPVRAFSRWSGAKPLVKRGSEVGESVFVGLPSEREVKAALLGGGFRWEGRIEQ